MAFLAGFSAGPAFAEDVSQPARVASIAPQAVTRSGPVTINGSGFGAKGSGYVLIGGQRAWTTTWTDTQVVAYVPESAAFGRNATEIVTGGFSITGPSLAVEARPVAQPTAQGHGGVAVRDAG